jgi:MoxR-like ATPase
LRRDGFSIRNFKLVRQLPESISNEGIRPSDRRYKQSLALLQAKALIDQRQEVKIGDLIILTNSLWETVDQKDKVKEVVQKHALDRITKLIKEVEDAASEINQLVINSSAVALEQLDKLKKLEQELINLNTDAIKTAEHQPELDRVMQVVVRAKQNIGSKMLE